MKYIEKENTLILAVSPANVDLANSDALDLSKKVDLNRERTIGVMTKVDIMDKGDDPCKFLRNERYKLKHGYILVKCRSQEDNNQGVSIDEAIKSEQRYFATDPAYAELDDPQGTKVLSHRLSILLCNHIKSQIPYIEEWAITQYSNYELRLKKLGDGIHYVNDLQAFSFITQVVEELSKGLKDLIQGDNCNCDDEKYKGGSLIDQIFKYYTEKKINELDPFKNLTNKRIFIEMKKSKGLNPQLFIPEEACRDLIKKNIELFLEPSITCAEKVHKVLHQAINEVMPERLEHMQNLNEFLQDTVEKLLETNFEYCKTYIEDYIDSEKSYINYDDENFCLIKPFIRTSEDPEPEEIQELSRNLGIHPKYFNREKALQSINRSVEKALARKEAQTSATNYSNGKFNEFDFDDWEVEQSIDISDGIGGGDLENIISMKRVIHGYYCIIKRMFKTNVPKYVTNFIIKKTMNMLKKEIFKELENRGNLKDLITEDQSIKNQRDNCINNIRVLKDVQKCLKRLKRNKI